MIEIPVLTGGEDVTLRNDRSLEDLLAAESLWVNEPMHQKSPMAHYSKIVPKIAATYAQ